MSINLVPSLSSDDTPSLNASIHSKASCSTQPLEVDCKDNRSSFQPNPLNNGSNAANPASAAAAASASTSTSTSTTTNNNDDQGVVLALSKVIRQDLNVIEDAIKKYVKHANEKINLACAELNQAREERNTRRSKTDLDELNKTVSKLKSQIVSKLKIADSKKPPRNRGSRGSASSSTQLDARDGLMYKNPKFEHTTEFEKFKVSFLGLPFQLKVCLLCFLAFPEHATIEKRFLVYWWIGEGILPPFLMDRGTEKEEIAQEKTAEDFGNEFFNELIAKGFIEPVYQKCSFFVDSCRIPPSVRSTLTILAETESVGGFLDEFRYWLNISESIIDEGPELFADMECIKILYLGRWQSWAKDVPHIEVVAEAKFFEGLKDMNHLRFLSFRGVSMITELPEFILQLINLKILDLRACYNLGVIPDGIDSLKNLTHLDMSECYFLDHMPKGLASLSQLQVLKGFIIRNSEDKKSCTLNDLAELPNLGKLNIYTSMKEFPTQKQFKVFQEFKVLRKLTIAWGGTSIESAAIDIVNPGIEEPFMVPLQKLDLEGCPGTIALSWLRPANLVRLKKLYIRGGKISNLGPLPELKNEGIKGKEEESWSAEVLRLKYLDELEMDWKQLGELFPKLIYLEKVECPKLTNFQCDEKGVWTNITTKSKQ